MKKDRKNTTQNDESVKIDKHLLNRTRRIAKQNKRTLKATIEMAIESAIVDTEGETND